RDDHLIEVSPPVSLRDGSRVAFRASPMAPGCRVVKMSVFSPEVKTRREAEWLLHLDPKAEIRAFPERTEARLGAAALDLFRLAPEDASATWEAHAVAKPEAEPFTFRETRRLTIRPPFSGDETFLLVLLHARAADAPSLTDVTTERRPGGVRVGWSSEGRPTVLVWDLAGRRVGLTAGIAADIPAPRPTVSSEPGPPAPSPEARPTFTEAIAPLLARRCAPCHVPGGRMHGRTPFDDEATVRSHSEGILRRLKGEDHDAVEKWLNAGS
ncbi:MAG TPA: hypothetical protein VIC87_15375, partial [Vicinamibacteria bacterium]